MPRSGITLSGVDHASSPSVSAVIMKAGFVSFERMTNSREVTRVWTLFRHYPPNFSGAAIQAHQIFERLVNQGFAVTVLAAGDQAASDLRGRVIERNGIAIRYLPILRTRDWSSLAGLPLLRKLIVLVNSLASSFSLATRSAWLLWQEGHADDVVQLYGCSEFSFIPVWVARLRGMHPAIQMTLLGSDDPGSVKGGPKNFFGTLKLEAFRKSEKIIGYSSAQVRSCESAGFDPGKVVRIPGGADLELFHPVSKEQQATLRARLGLELTQRYIVFVGAAVFRKGIDVMIDAFIKVAKDLHDVQLLVVGPSDFTDLTRYIPVRQELLDELKEKLTNRGLAARTHWLGDVDNVHEYLQAADIFCLPTRREGFGIVIAEAMATALPVVVQRLEGVTTDLIVTGSNGILIESHDSDDYAEALLELLRDPVQASELAVAARKRAESDFDLQAITERFALLYRELVASGIDDERAQLVPNITA
jgi:glycosyltransferase involved in cell wall biosynthesis